MEVVMERLENLESDMIDLGHASAETQGIGLVDRDNPAGQQQTGILDE
ncbi:benenodin family lasso peptide [Sphingobium sp. PAMC28499]|jgi:hypothetical protein|nr:benenodin family lasso peptide [Sphingobium sp. PAMC28499]|tara:strand:+ start:3189 stop:3332 length:144 start_codon:yes stop_codon:yes gene_type:complete